MYTIAVYSKKLNKYKKEFSNKTNNNILFINAFSTTF